MISYMRNSHLPTNKTVKLTQTQCREQDHDIIYDIIYRYHDIMYDNIYKKLNYDIIKTEISYVIFPYYI